MAQNQAYELQALMQNADKRNFSNTKFIAITSGKGGVGKSNISANLAYHLCKMGKKVAIFDADIGLANLDLIFGVKPEFNILHALKGEVNFEKVIYTIQKDLLLIPGDNGEEILKYANSGVFERFLNESSILDSIDYMLIDTGAGIGGITQGFLDASDMVVVIATPEPSAIADAYATIKLNAKSHKEIAMIINMCKGKAESNQVFERIVNTAAKNIPHLKLLNLGFIESSPNIAQAVRAREIVSTFAPNSLSTMQIELIAKNIASKMERNMLNPESKRNFAYFMRSMLGHLGV